MVEEKLPPPGAEQPKIESQPQPVETPPVEPPAPVKTQAEIEILNRRRQNRRAAREAQIRSDQWLLDQARQDAIETNDRATLEKLAGLEAGGMTEGEGIWLYKYVMGEASYLSTLSKEERAKLAMVQKEYSYKDLYDQGEAVPIDEIKNIDLNHTDKVPQWDQVTEYLSNGINKLISDKDQRAYAREYANWILDGEHGEPPTSSKISAAEIAFVKKQVDLARESLLRVEARNRTTPIPLVDSDASYPPGEGTYIQKVYAFKHGQYDVVAEVYRDGEPIALYPAHPELFKEFNANGGEARLLGIDRENPALWVYEIDGEIKKVDPDNPSIEKAEPTPGLEQGKIQSNRNQINMFSESQEDLPLFSGTPIPVDDVDFRPKEASPQMSLFEDLVPEAKPTRIVELAIRGSDGTSYVRIDIQKLRQIEETLKLHQGEQITYRILDASGKVITSGTNPEDIYSPSLFQVGLRERHELPDIEGWINDDSLTQTIDRYKINNEWTADRAELHDKFIRDQFDSVQPPPEGQQPRAIILMGLPASGKTSVRDMSFAQGDLISNYVVVDPDMAKSYLPEFEVEARRKNKSGPAIVHEESSEMAKALQEKAITSGKNVIIDGVGSSPEKYRNLLTRLKTIGYDVTLIMVDVEPEQAWEGMKARANNNGRYIPQDFLWMANENVPKNFMELYPLADKATLFYNDNNNYRVILNKNQKGESINDREHWQQFQQRYGKDIGRVYGESPAQRGAVQPGQIETPGAGLPGEWSGYGRAGAGLPGYVEEGKGRGGAPEEPGRVDPTAPMGEVPLNGTPSTEPYGEVLHEINSEYLRTILDKFGQEYKKQMGEARKFSIGSLDEDTRKEITRYINGSVKNDMAGMKLSAMNYGEQMRDSALLNYSRRYGVDNFLNIISPYQFWYTRSYYNWAKRMMDRPGWYAMYARMKQMQEKLDQKMPTRLKGKSRIPMPWMPDWMGGGYWIDPMKQLFPFEQFTDSIDQYTRDSARVGAEAESQVDEMLNAGLITPQEAKDAKQNHSGNIWNRAVKQAEASLDKNISPASLATMMLSPALWWTIPKNIAQGTPEKISVLPITRTGQAVREIGKDTFAEGLTDIVGGLLAGPEEAIRKANKLSEFGQWGDYYIDRQLANMAGEGLITADEARIAMIERQGEAFDMARERVATESAMRTPGVVGFEALKNNAKWYEILPAFLSGIFGGSLFPTGELKLRGLQDEYNNAWKKFKTGDESAINDFFADHPEYEARLALFADPDTRLHEFLVDQVWRKYTSLAGPNKKKVREALGQEFIDSFLDENTRNTDTVSDKTLIKWVQQIGGMVPSSLKDENIQKVDYYNAVIANAAENYQKERNARFPNWYELQQQYYALPRVTDEQKKAYLGSHPELSDTYKTVQAAYRAGDKEAYSKFWDAQPLDKRRAFLRSHPELANYWSWNRNFKAQHPELAGYFEDQAQEYQNNTPSLSEAELKQMTNPLIRQLLDYYTTGEPLSSGAWSEIKRIWELGGKKSPTINEYLDTVVSQSFVQ